MKLPTLSKTKFVGGLQCHKLLWYQVNRKELIPQPSLEKQQTFDRGHQVGALAQSLYPEGIEVNWGIFSAGLELTKLYMRRRIPVFEAGFLANGTHARADIMSPVGDDEWDVYEVKSVEKIKDVFIRDIAFQLFCYKSAGIKVRKCFVMHLREGVGEIDNAPANELFQSVDVTQEVIGMQKHTEEQIARLREVAGNSSCPNIRMGDHCHKPYDCLMIPLCSRR